MLLMQVQRLVLQRILLPESSFSAFVWTRENTVFTWSALEVRT